MGIDQECFVHPERISPELICPICTQVLDNPVQTPSEHLFCEDELLEWMIQSDVCPVTKATLKPDDIRKPGRIICNLLGELVRFCPNKSEGCKWQGNNCNVQAHISKSCEFKPRTELLKEIETKGATIDKLKTRNDKLQLKIKSLESNNRRLADTASELERKLKVYDAFIREADGGAIPGSIMSDGAGESHPVSDLERIARLRRLESLEAEINFDYGDTDEGEESSSSHHTFLISSGKQSTRKDVMDSDKDQKGENSSWHKEGKDDDDDEGTNADDKKGQLHWL